MRYGPAHEMNAALVSGKLIRKDIFTRSNGKRAVRFTIENIVCSHWGNEVVQFKSVIYCVAFGAIARVVWYDIGVGERIFVTGRIEWKPTNAAREDKDGLTYGVQSVVVNDIVRMRGDPVINPTWGEPGDGRHEPADPQEPNPRPPGRYVLTKTVSLTTKPPSSAAVEKPPS